MGSFLALFWPRPPSDFLLLISTHYSITPSVNGKLLKVAFVSREVTVGTNNKVTYGGYYAQGLTPKLDETGLNGTLLNIIVAYYGDKSDYHVNCNVKYFKGDPYFSVSSVLESRTILVVFALLYY